MSVSIGAPVNSIPLKPTRKAAEFAQKVDVLALSIGSKVSASAILLACVVVILIGAQSMLSALHSMDSDIKEMNVQLSIANVGVGKLNESLNAVEPMANSMHDIVKTIDSTGDEVDVSAKTISKMASTSSTLDHRLSGIATSTSNMATSFDQMSGETSKLASTIGGLNGQIGPLAQTQHGMYLQTVRMRGGLDSMNQSLAYVVRVLNYMTAPPSGQDFSIRAELPKETLPPVPGIRVEVEPMSVFQRLSWPIYKG